MIWEQVHFIRPAWLVVIPLLIALSFFLSRRKSRGGWEKVIPEPMLKALVSEPKQGKNTRLIWVSAIAILLGLAMAGPTWDRYPQPAVQSEQALVIVFDLSPSMLATDLAPDRLTRARLKVLDLLRERGDGQTALVAYAGAPHTVAPMTTDARSMDALVPVLHPNIMPSTGSHTEAAIALALELIDSAGLTSGDIVLITDGVEPEAQREILDTLQSGVRLSILGIGTSEGAPIPDEGGGFLRNSRNEIVIARLNRAELAGLAQTAGGIYVDLQADNSDILSLTNLFQINFSSSTSDSEQFVEFDIWHDRGPWLVLLLLPLLALSFRRGAVFILPLFLVLPIESANALEWDELWYNSDQRGSRALQEENHALAADEFTSSDWRGYAQYQNGDFEAAAREFENDLSAAGRFNMGNALTQLGDYDGAIKAYDEAAALQPDLEGLDQNRQIAEIIKALEEEQAQQNEQEADSSENGENQQSEDSQQNAENSESNSDKGENQQSSESSQDSSQAQSDPQSEDSEQRPSDQSSESATDDPAEDADGDVEGEESEESSVTAGLDENNEGRNEEEEELSMAALPVAETSDQEDAQNEQWLRAIRDDPGGLLRRKFEYEADVNEYLQRYGAPTAPGTEERY